MPGMSFDLLKIKKSFLFTKLVIVGSFLVGGLAYADENRLSGDIFWAKCRLFYPSSGHEILLHGIMINHEVLPVAASWGHSIQYKPFNVIPIASKNPKCLTTYVSKGPVEGHKCQKFDYEKLLNGKSRQLYVCEDPTNAYQFKVRETVKKTISCAEGTQIEEGSTPDDWQDLLVTGGIVKDYVAGAETYTFYGSDGTPFELLVRPITTERPLSQHPENAVSDIACLELVP